jgi:hypothetical protein
MGSPSLAKRAAKHGLAKGGHVSPSALPGSSSLSPGAPASEYHYNGPEHLREWAMAKHAKDHGLSKPDKKKKKKATTKLANTSEDGSSDDDKPGPKARGKSPGKKA